MGKHTVLSAPDPQLPPAGYAQWKKINLQTNKKAALIINLGALVIAAAMVLPVIAGGPSIRLLFDMEQGLGVYLLRFGVLALGCLGYVVLHELTHAIVMKAYGARHVRFGFTGLYAYAGCTDCFARGPYFLIALAPVAVFALVFQVLVGLVPESWFWVVYIWQVMNISGAAGDIFICARVAKMPADIRIRDTGVEMTFFRPQQ